MMIEALLAGSIILNVILFMYIRWFLKGYASLTNDIQTINQMIFEFTAHVKGIHDLEMFYGDQTLAGLMEHGKQILDRLEDLDLLEEEYDNDDDQTETEEAA
jgi:hypothetical protein